MSFEINHPVPEVVLHGPTGLKFRFLESGVQLLAYGYWNEIKNAALCRRPERFGAFGSVEERTAWVMAFLEAVQSKIGQLPVGTFEQQAINIVYTDLVPGGSD